jgi:hypothetical protein
MITAEQAADALKEASAAERRSARAYRYRRASPHLYLWGVVWVLGYGGSEVAPHLSGWIWTGLIVAAAGASVWIGQQAPLSARDARWRAPLLFTAFAAFFAATYTVMAPVSHLQQAAFPPLVVAMVYVAMGMWLGLRFAIAGVALGVLTMAGFFYLPEHFMLWQGLVGGAALILAGVWFRQV